jgi:phosphopantothenoylcysteine synthetase/decarboxylase
MKEPDADWLVRTNKRILVTSGGTKVSIDGVRHIDNMSAGTFGSAIATEVLKTFNHVIFFNRKDSKSPFQLKLNLAEPGNTTFELKKWVDMQELVITELSRKLTYWPYYHEENFTDFSSYSDGLKKLIDLYKPDTIVLAAAVSDYDVKNYVSGKIRTAEDLKIELEPLPKIIGKIKGEWGYKGKVIGFKLLVNSTEEELIAASLKSIRDNGCDVVIANDLRDIKNSNHTVLFVYPDGTHKKHMSSDSPDDKNYLANLVAMEALIK